MNFPIGTRQGTRQRTATLVIHAVDLPIGTADIHTGDIHGDNQ
jgi:hypothetical protein